MMRLVLLCLVLLGTGVTALSFSQVIDEEFNLFKLQYGKKYVDQTAEEYRKRIYIENREKIALHNQMYHQGLVNYTMDMNRFGDLLRREFIEMMTGYKNSGRGLSGGSTFFRPSHLVLPDRVDWRKEGYVTPVKDQKHCAACWAFSSTGSLEGQHFRKTGKLVSLSEQNLVDCSRSYGNFGCGGGWMHKSFKYVKENGGIDTEESYPYKAKDQDCHYNAETVGATDTGYVHIERGSEEKLQEAVATVGPVSVAIDAGHHSFMFYSEGVYYEPECTQFMNHGVLAVGYDTDAKGGDYWIVKNSWGEDWGEKGYIKMARNRDNMCGVANDALYPLV